MSRKKWIVAAILSLALVLLAASALADAYWVKTGDGKTVNVRWEDGTNGSVMTRLKYGTKIDVITFTKGGTWALFTYDGPTLDGGHHYGDAYVMAKFLVPYKPEPYSKSSSSSSSSSGQQQSSGSGSMNALFSQARLVTPYTVTVRPTRSSGQVNVRWAPSKGSTLLRGFPSDYQLTVLAELGTDWYQVQDPSSGAVGFLNKAYIVK